MGKEKEEEDGGEEEKLGKRQSDSEKWAVGWRLKGENHVFGAALGAAAARQKKEQARRDQGRTHLNIYKI